MSVILETKNFTVIAPGRPHHSRENGGHIIILPRQTFTHRYEMAPQIASEFMHLSMLVGEAATNVLRDLGIDIVRINYQDNGNWAYKETTPHPATHLHLYMRTFNEKHPAEDARFQSFPEALTFPPYESGYYDTFKPLTEKDCRLIRDACEQLNTSEKYNYLNLL